MLCCCLKNFTSNLTLKCAKYFIYVKTVGWFYLHHFKPKPPPLPLPPHAPILTDPYKNTEFWCSCRLQGHFCRDGLAVFFSTGNLKADLWFDCSGLALAVTGLKMSSPITENSRRKFIIQPWNRGWCCMQSAVFAFLFIYFFIPHILRRGKCLQFDVYINFLWPSHWFLKKDFYGSTELLWYVNEDASIWEMNKDFVCEGDEKTESKAENK